MKKQNIPEKVFQDILEFIPQILDQAKNGIVISDPNLEDNPLVYVNKAFCQMFGYDKDEVIGTNCRFLQRGETNQTGVELIRAAIKNQKSTTVILKNFTKNGEAVFNEITISPIFDSANNLKFFLGVQKDVSREHELLKKIKLNSEI